MKTYDVIIIGAGAAGLSAAIAALKNQKSVLVLDMGNAPARKVAVSGGGKCNITNMAVGVDRYFGENRNFVRGALSRVTPNDILAWCAAHNISVYEKTPGRYFCSDGATAVVGALMYDVKDATIKYNTAVTSVSKSDDMFIIMSNNGDYRAKSVIVATGGTSFGTLGVSDTGYKIAKSFGHKIIPVRPGLCGIACPDFSGALAGISIPVEITVNKEIIYDDMLFTHIGIGGPAIYRATVRDISNGITINMCPGMDLFSLVKGVKSSAGRRSISSIISQYLPSRLAHFMADNDKNIADIPDSGIKDIVSRIQSYYLKPTDIKLHNLASAEIVRGGVSTDKISSKTMESQLCPGLYFAGEVLDISGDLGGFNLHWAWASGTVAGQNA